MARRNNSSKSYFIISSFCYCVLSIVVVAHSRAICRLSESPVPGLHYFLDATLAQFSNTPTERNHETEDAIYTTIRPLLQKPLADKFFAYLLTHNDRILALNSCLRVMIPSSKDLSLLGSREISTQSHSIERRIAATRPCVAGKIRTTVQGYR